MGVLVDCLQCLHPVRPLGLLLTGKDEPRVYSASTGGNPLLPFHADIVSDWSPMHEAAVHGRLLSLRSLINQVRGFWEKKR